MKRILAVLTGLATLAAAPAHAVGTLTDITVYDRSEGRVLPVYQHQGRHYVVGKPGNEYQVVVGNRTAGDVLAVISVDGVNAVSGETANWGQTGYVFGANQSYPIAGWRKSMDRIAAFYFTDLGNSYAARTGRPDNVGVIGVAVFRRKAEPPVAIAPPPRSQPYPYPRRDRYESPAASNEAPAPYEEGTAADSASAVGRAAPAPMQERQRAEAKLGTGHGRSETSVVTNTQFERESPAPNEVVTIYYDTYRNLVAQGVIRERPVVARPAPFPGQFVPDPR
jgi:hypothetical protein